ncbi:MAG: branched-chain amino acid aminotransferase [Lactobacillus sp.]
MQAAEVDFNHLGFSYIETDYRYVARYHDGHWEPGRLIKDAQVRVNEAANIFHYGQGVFEGLKAYRCQDDSVNLFRPEQNAARMQQSCQRLLMPTFPVDEFVAACKAVVKANLDWLPPYQSHGSMYVRPYMIGLNGSLQIHPATDYLFSVFAFPVGAYFKAGFKPVDFVTSDYDRAAPQGTGAYKVGGNYAGSLLPEMLAIKAGYNDCVYLDPATHTKIEEVGSANFFGITPDHTFVTPKSPSILPSVTKRSLLALAGDRFGLKTVEGYVPIDQLDVFSEAGACGTAAVIAPIGSITHRGKRHVFYSETEAGPTTKKLYDELVGIQYGNCPAPAGWITKVPTA